MSDIDTKKIRACAHLLGVPACGVVRDLVDEIDRLVAELEKTRAVIGEIGRVVESDEARRRLEKAMHDA